MNIFDLADQNSNNLQEKVQSGQNDQNPIGKFVGFVKDRWTISINMKPSDLLKFLSSGRHKNKYEVAREDVEMIRKMGETDVSVEQLMEKRLKGYHEPRTEFTRVFEDGERFKYGALNIGGLGPTKYGSYCVVIKRERSEEFSVLAFIKEDSLNNYVDGGHVDIERLKHDVANRECVPILAVIKHRNDVEGLSANECASMVCCDEHYIEAITTDDILNKHINSVRMSKKESSHVEKQFFDVMYRGSSDIEKRHRIDDFINIRNLLAANRIKLEVLCEDGI